MTRAASWTSWLTAIVSIAACGGSSSVAPPRTEAARDTAEATPPPIPWAEMSHDEKRRWMAREVLPRMAERFEEYDRERFSDFACQTCHGDDMVERGYEMPNPGILALHPTGSPEQQQMVTDHPEMVTFMYSHVRPLMQTLLGEPAYDEETGEGFSCFFCHPRGDTPDVEGD